ncbi:MAG: hypothetical protein HY652_04050, partial [Acidobacteria bacterium]|nr:hypothetical protein [Acidobacteriota bacterium]
MVAALWLAGAGLILWASIDLPPGWSPAGDLGRDLRPNLIRYLAGTGSLSLGMIVCALGAPGFLATSFGAGIFSGTLSLLQWEPHLAWLFLPTNWVGAWIVSLIAPGANPGFLPLIPLSFGQWFLVGMLAGWILNRTEKKNAAIPFLVSIALLVLSASLLLVRSYLSRETGIALAVSISVQIFPFIVLLALLWYLTFFAPVASLVKQVAPRTYFLIPITLLLCLVGLLLDFEPVTRIFALTILASQA